MTMHKLILEDIDDSQYSLIAIHCTLEDYKMAYLLNKHLKINLFRKSKDLDFHDKKGYFSLYEWKDEKSFMKWNLISNVCKIEEEGDLTSGSLFSVPNKFLRTYNLIPEYKKVNYFLKVDNDGNFINEKIIIDKIQEISQIVTVYSVDATQLKSKDNLIFI